MNIVFYVLIPSFKVYAAIEDMKNNRSSNQDFSTDLYGSEYDNHIDILTSIKVQAPERYHALMHKFYEDATYVSPSCS